MGAQPVGLPGLAALWLGLFAFAVALVAARRGAGREARGNVTRSRRSMAGIAVQGCAIFLVAVGVERVVLDPLGGAALAEAAAVAVLMAAAVALFVWSTRTMGRNWSIVARTRGDHTLVTTGPFAHLRHPIYTALFLLLVAMAVATGHWPRLAAAIPLYALGTWLRIAEEERMLADLFGGTYAAGTARVPRFVPGVF
ncbi:MAG: methyltransferase family protein [Janthinobacterium lividum]